jgi:hypothetical protein
MADVNRAVTASVNNERRDAYPRKLAQHIERGNEPERSPTVPGSTNLARGEPTARRSDDRYAPNGKCRGPRTSTY